ncbi:hypothetical protein [Thermobacillus sp. ZCTH02-B1]|uniref:hypothetical protein n=1 Tax=Thermobacillus sp. ZCTH02-B1 TaxID=1858795 RepID=UPI0025FF4D0A|nr:hypothetical protein [Thermobacillus sp. ZCTH02-B1]
MRIQNMKPAATIAVYAVCAVLAVWFGVYYFSVKVFELEFRTYRAAEKTGQYIRYASDAGPPVTVRVDRSDRVVTIEGQDYRIREEQTPGMGYRVLYPDGSTYKVEEQGSMLLAYDENGELLVGGGMVLDANGQWIPSEEEEPRYHPTGLVRAAYPKYHETRGYPWLYVAAVLLFAFGWANFRYEKFQRAMFWLSLEWLWVENPEPSEFYFIMTRIFGIVSMALAFVFFLQSLTRNHILLVF